MRNITRIASGALLAALIGGLSTGVSAQTNARSNARADFEKSIKGKTVAWVPMTLGVPITEMWTEVMRQSFERYGMKFVVRDPNWNSDAQLQAVNSLINDKVDVLIVMNQNVSTLATAIKRAMDNGIYVIQVNQMSNQASDAYVGVDWSAIGHTIAQEIVARCGNGKGSGKVAIVQGEANATGSVDQLNGAMEVFNADKSIKVVSSQAANWDGTKANQLTATVLQQHPDLCATYGFWGGMQAGAAQAVKEAGKQATVKVYTSSDGPSSDCDMVEQGLFTKALSYRADVQGTQIVDATLTLLQNADKPGAKHLAFFSNNYWIADKADRNYCYKLPANKS
ncbi:MAG: sugar ABC transporter substrate-binding protein [Bradyrhizobium sp.]|nr:sugar ABC transporter substrate-binding protein [Bradyrhizobium sp.]